MGKKGKKSKKQLEEELLKAQEDLVEREALDEEKRVADEATKTAADEAETLRVERLAKEEKDRLEAEGEPAAAAQNEKRSNFEYVLADFDHNRDWNRFLSCDPKPNVHFENEISSYIESSSAGPMESIPQALFTHFAGEDIVEDLKNLYAEAKGTSNAAKQEWATKFIQEFREMGVTKIDQATGHILQHIEKQNINARQEVQETWGNVNSPVRVGFWGSLQTKGFRAKVVDHSNINVLLELPKSISVQAGGQTVGIRSLYSAFDNISRNITPSLSIGGVLRVELFVIPPVPRRQKNWVVRTKPTEESGLTKLEYPASDTNPATLATLQACKVEYKVPTNVWVSANPKVAVWDPHEEEWSTENIEEFFWDEHSRRVSFYSLRMGYYSLIQPKILDLNYQFWYFRPKMVEGNVEVEYHLKTPRIELIFNITSEGVYLVGPALPELKWIIFQKTGEEAEAHAAGRNVLGNGGDGKQQLPESPKHAQVVSRGNKSKRNLYTDPVRILVDLRHSGINLLPEDEDVVEGLTKKDIVVERKAYADLSSLCLSHDVVYSKHNRSAGKDATIVRLRANPLFDLHSVFDPENDKDYTTCVIAADKASLTPGTDQKLDLTQCCAHKTVSMCLAARERDRELANKNKQHQPVEDLGEGEIAHALTKEELEIAHGHAAPSVSNSMLVDHVRKMCIASRILSYN